MPAVRSKLVDLFKLRVDRRSKTVEIDKSNHEKPASTPSHDTNEVPVRLPSPDTFTGSPLLQLPTELLILIITNLNDDFLEHVPDGTTDTLPALRL
jgi:hypothetical protein